tara:strand:- start:580 stop:894 length:315 start_codon:yes stop_codon:yes gene_type:complete
MKFKKVIILILSLVFLYSCGLEGALQGKKRSENSDEFLVEKKNPLTKPPDIDELPVPLDQEENEKSETVDIKKVLEIGDTKNTTTISDGDQKSLEQSVLEKINN